MLDSFKKRRANDQNREGRRLLDTGNLLGAQAAFESALRLQPHFAEAWFNLALVHKFRREWSETVECNLRVVELIDASTNDPAWWNMGIAATALHDWQTARRAWRAYGVTIQSEEGPIVEDFGLAPIRVDPRRNPEIVWATRIDPARAVIQSVPFPDSGRSWRDCILNDGVPNGERMLNGQPRAVLDEIDVWESSGVPTLVAKVECSSEQDSDELSRLFFDAGYAAEDWTKDVRLICKACSEGLVDVPHNHQPETGWSSQRRFGFATTEEEASDLAGRWVTASPSQRSVQSIERAL